MRQLPPNVLEEIYFKSIIPAVIYGIVVWGNCSSAMLNSLNPIHVTNKYTNKCMYMHVCMYVASTHFPHFYSTARDWCMRVITEGSAYQLRCEFMAKGLLQNVCYGSEFIKATRRSMKTYIFVMFFDNWFIKANGLFVFILLRG